MDDDAKQPLTDLIALQKSLPELCRKVIHHHQRVEIRTDEGDACVLISRTELETLERALEIYAGTDDAQHLHEKVAELCDLAGEPSPEAERAAISL